MDIEELTRKQFELGESIQKSFTNSKKDPKERKSAKDYVRKRRDELSRNWASFTQQHSSILTLNCQGHEYIEKKFYTQVSQLVVEYGTYLDDLEKSLARLSPTFERRDFEATGGTTATGPLTNPNQPTSFVLQTPLIKKQMNKINRLKKLIEETLTELQSEHSPKYWEYKKEAVSQQWVNIQQLQEDIELSDNNSEPTAAAYDDMEKYVLEVMERLCGQLTDESASSASDKLKLPRIDIPQFDGNYEGWSSFHDLFVRFIHSNKRLANVEKMQYLKTRVKGEASRLLHHLSISDSNYEIAWDLLKNRFDNKRMILFTHINNIFSVPRVTNAAASELKQIHDTIVESKRAIDNLEISTDSWGPIIIHILQEKLDKETLRAYEQSLQFPKQIPDLTELLAFIESRFNSLELLNKKKPGKEFANPRYSNHVKFSKCDFCKEKHSLHVCKKFLDLSVKERFNFVKQQRLCINCLHHDTNTKCQSKYTCMKCKKRHHTILHFEQAANSVPEERPISSNTTTKVTTTVLDDATEVLLTTAVIEMKDFSGTWRLFRALIDQGSQSSFITEEAAESLGLPRKMARMQISGVGGSGIVTPIRGKLSAVLKPRFAAEFQLRCELMILRKITSSLPSEDTAELMPPENMILADPTYNSRGPIDVLLGSDTIPMILKRGIRKHNGCVAQNTELGWVLSGPIKLSGSCVPKEVRSMIGIAEDSQLTKFWELEELPQAKEKTIEEEQCEQFYDETTVRNDDLSYTVRLPFKEPTESIGESRRRALVRLFQMEKNFQKDPDFAVQYKQFMREYEEMSHMQPAIGSPTNAYYIPHHAVRKADSTTTKLRVVFDASAKSTSGKALNDIMFTGPRLQEDLCRILMRWRKHQIVLTADVEKMYRQIKVHEKDQIYQSILWRYDSSEPIREYRLATVTYGTSSAPYLAVKTLQRLATDELENYPLASQITLKDFYVDDLLTGADSIDEARFLQSEMISLLNRGRFNLRKWKSNCLELVSTLPKYLQDKDFLEIGEIDTRKMLGVHWAPRSDMFKYHVRMNFEESPTKRKVVSQIAQLYDPLGWLAPIVIRAKIFIQEMWVSGCGWDEAVPDEMKVKWKKFQSELPRVEDIEIPRWIGYTKSTSTIELHGFSDASEKAYGAVVYTKTVSTTGETTITLLTAKSKVAPIKSKVTLPRLELCGAELLSQLLQQALNSLNIDNTRIYAWSDSTITLAWIQGQPERWTTFVQNRVSRINKILPPTAWHHVNSHDNPADLVSRGICPGQLKEKSIWWTGPSWLREWSPQPQHSMEFTTDLESRKKVKVVHSATQEKNDVLRRFSSWAATIRVVAYCKRFINGCQKSRNPSSRLLVTEELKAAHDSLIRLIQREHFLIEFKSLEKNEPLHKASKLSKLLPFIDVQGVLRVGGRLENASMSFEEKHPIILPHNEQITELIVREFHAKMLHGGHQLTLTAIRARYWIIRGSSLVRSVVHKCVRCCRFRTAPSNQLMGDLPECRVSVAPPFSRSGLDYAGPIYLRMSKGRGTKSFKGFIAIFVCMVTKAIHLEAVSDMTTAAFLAAFKRFVSRRGHCSDIYSDNGTTFVGARTVLDANLKNAIKDVNFLQYLASEGTNWHFIPPGAPHFGGLWEAGVKSTKFHLKRVVGNSTLTFEELTTVLCQIEACLNSRPLCVTNNEIPEEQFVLTPSHFLIGRGSYLQADEMDLKEDLNPTSRWKLLQAMKREFWSKWSAQYLHKLQQRYKWYSPQPNIKENDVVLVKDENVNPTKWPLARVTDVHPGKDGKVRVVSVKTSKGTIYKRPITKVCPLPIDNNTDNIPADIKVEKRANLRPVSAVTYLLLACFSMFTFCSGSSYTIKTPGTGLYIERIGEVYLHRGILKIDVPINVTQFTDHDRLVNTTLLRVKEVCDAGKYLSNAVKCDFFLQELQERYAELQLHIHIIQKGYHNRIKRGLLGEFLTSVFGVNDEVYTDIDQLNDNQKQIIQSAKQQSVIMVRTMTSLNETEHRITTKLNQFTEKLNQGLDEIHALESWYRSVDTNKLNIHIIYVYQLALGLINEVSGRYEKLLKIIHHQGDILDFLTVKEFHRLISSTTYSLGSHMEVKTKHLIKMTMEHQEEQIVVSAYYHIAEKSSYEFINIVPIPQRVRSNLFTAIKLDSPLVAVDYNKQHYFELSSEEFNQAIQLEDNKFLVSVDVIHDINQEPSCVIDIIYARSKEMSCSQQSFPVVHVIWKRLYMMNTWLFVTNSTVRVGLECHERRSDLWLNGTGILQVDQRCIIDTGRKLLKTQLTQSIQGVTAFHKLLNLSAPDVWHTLDRPNPLEREPTFKADEDFVNLLRDESLLQSNLSTTDWTAVHSHVISSGVSLLITCLIIGAIMTVLWCIRRRTWSPPTRPSFFLARQDVQEEQV